MLPIIDPSAQQFLDSVSRLQARLQDAQRAISSGKRLNRASDAPDQVSPVLQLHADIEMNSAVLTNLQQVKTEVDSGEQTLSASVDLLQQASVIATQATGPLQTAQTRATLAASVDALLQQMVANSNAMVGGRYIFSGDADQNPSYQIDATAPTGVLTLQSRAATRRVAGPNGAAFTVSLPAGQIFDVRNPDGTVATGNVFAALNDLKTALSTNNDAGIRSSISSLSDASRYLNNQLAFYGQTQQHIGAAIVSSQNYDTRLEAELSVRQDADLATEITTMQQAEVQMQAALQTRAQMPRTSLFDLLSR